MPKNDDLVVVTEEVNSKDILKRIFNEAERGPRRKPLLSVEAKKASQKAKKDKRSEKQKNLRAERLVAGLCTKCGKCLPVLGSRLCDPCQRRGREYMKGR